MSSLIIHPSLNEHTLEQELISCFENKRISQKFLYETQRQSDLWLNVHEQFAPPPEISTLYLKTGSCLSKLVGATGVALVGLGCGSGEKDLAILTKLHSNVKFVPTDASIPLVRGAVSRAKDQSVRLDSALVFDLSHSENIFKFIEPHLEKQNIFTFFGLIPNFQPTEILPILHSLIRPDDFLLLSANLAPQGIDTILPQYDNQPTKEWLIEFLYRFGQPTGKINISVERSNDLEFISAKFIFSSTSIFNVGGNEFLFNPHEEIDLFTSYRYTKKSIKNTLAMHGFNILEEFISNNREEGLFLCRTQ